MGASIIIPLIPIITLLSLGRLKNSISTKIRFFLHFQRLIFLFYLATRIAPVSINLVSIITSFLKINVHYSIPTQFFTTKNITNPSFFSTTLQITTISILLVPIITLFHSLNYSVPTLILLYAKRRLRNKPNTAPSLFNFTVGTAAITRATVSVIAFLSFISFSIPTFRTVRWENLYIANVVILNEAIM